MDGDDGFLSPLSRVTVALPQPCDRVSAKADARDLYRKMTIFARTTAKGIITIIIIIIIIITISVVVIKQRIHFTSEKCCGGDAWCFTLLVLVFPAAGGGRKLKSCSPTDPPC
uniref:Uncharacterized protein n=1 Tax=Anopheles farauti TaxID=69004 RepID=A0A182QUK0_9DIPT